VNMTSHASKRTRALTAYRENEPFFLLCMQVFVLHIGQSMISPILPLYARMFAVSTMMVGFLFTSQGIVRIGTSLPAGRLADRVGANRLLAAAAGVVTISSLIGGLAQSYSVLLVSMLVQGLGTSVSMTSGLTYTANVSNPGNRTRHLSIFQGSFILGNSVGPAFGGLTAQYFGYRAPFLIYGALAFLVGLWMLTRLPDSRASILKNSEERTQRPGIVESMRGMFSHPGVVLVALIGLLAAYTRAGSRNLGVPLLGQEIGLSESQIGLTLSLMAIATVVVLFGAGSLADRFGTKATLVPSWLLTAVGLIIVAAVPGYGPFLVGAGIWGLSSGIGAPIPVAYIANVVDDASQGAALGFYRTFNDAGLLLGPLAMGWIGDRSGVKAGLWVNAGLVILVALLFWILAPSDEKGSKPMPSGKESQEP